MSPSAFLRRYNFRGGRAKEYPQPAEEGGEDQFAMSDVSTSLPQFLPTAATQESAQRFTLPARPLKIAAATAIALVGAYGVTMDQQYVSTSNAVITAYVLDVRTPIEGTLQDVPATAGEMVPAGALLGRIENDLTDHQHLDNLRITGGRGTRQGCGPGPGEGNAGRDPARAAGPCSHTHHGHAAKSWAADRSRKHGTFQQGGCPGGGRHRTRPGT